MTHIIYVGDPMCSWCYGFGPELAGFLKAIPEPKLDIVMGGLRPHGVQLITPDFHQFLDEHWAQVEAASGLKLNRKALDHPGMVYDTEPACRAFVTAHMLYPELPSMTQLAVFVALQQAFYGQGQNVTQTSVLVSTACQALTRLKFPTSERKFLAMFDSDQAKNHTKSHFEQAGRWGINGFPSLVVVKDDKLFLLSSGYTKTAALIEAFQKIMAQPG